MRAVLSLAAAIATACPGPPTAPDCVRSDEYSLIGDPGTGTGTATSSHAGFLAFDTPDGKSREARFPAIDGTSLLADNEQFSVTRFQPGSSGDLGLTSGEAAAPLQALLEDGTGVVLAIIDPTEPPLTVVQHRVVGQCKEPREPSLLADDSQLIVQSDSGEVALASGEETSVVIKQLSYLVHVLVAFDNNGVLVSSVFLLRNP